MPRKESMDKFVERRTAHIQAKDKAKREGPPPLKGHGKDSKDSKGPSRSAWMENAFSNKMKREK